MDPLPASLSQRYRRSVLLARLVNVIGIPLLVAVIALAIVMPPFAFVFLGVWWLVWMATLGWVYRRVSAAALECLRNGICPNCAHPAPYDDPLGYVCSSCRRVYLSSGRRSRRTERGLAAGRFHRSATDS